MDSEIFSWVIWALDGVEEWFVTEVVVIVLVVVVVVVVEVAGTDSRFAERLEGPGAAEAEVCEGDSSARSKFAT